MTPRSRAGVKSVTPINRPDPGVTTLSDVKPEKVKWLWPGYLPAGKLVIVDGDPSTGKSTLMMDLAARVSTGAKWPDGSPGKRGGAGVLLLSAEDGLSDTIVPRLMAADGDPTKVHALTEVPDGHGGNRPPSLPIDLPRIETLIKKNKVALMVVDVLMAYLGADSYRDQSVRSVFSPLSAMAERTGCTIIMIRHVTKGSNKKNSLYRGSGSIGIVGAVRAGYLLYRDPGDEDRRILRTTKNNLAPEAPARAYRLEDVPEFGCARVEWEPAPVLDIDLDARARAERDEAVDFLIGYLETRGGEASRVDVMANATGAGFSAATTKRAKDRAGIRHRSEGFPRQTIWYLPDFKKK